MLLTEWSKRTGVLLNPPMVDTQAIGVSIGKKSPHYESLLSLEDYKVLSEKDGLVLLVPSKGMHQTKLLWSEQEFRFLSFYTLSRLQETTHYANPIVGLPDAIKNGHVKGELTVDSLGNFLCFR